MLAAAVHERGDALAGYEIDPPAEQREAFRGIVDYGRREVELAREPRFHGVLVRGRYIEQVRLIARERSNVAIKYLLRGGVASSPNRQADREYGDGCRRQYPRAPQRPPPSCPWASRRCFGGIERGCHALAERRGRGLGARLSAQRIAHGAILG